MTDCELLVLNRRDFMPFLENHPDICLMLIRILCRRLRRTSEQVEDMQLPPLAGRIAKALAAACPERPGRPEVPAARPLELHLSQSDLDTSSAARARASTSSCRFGKRPGLIDLAKGSIVIRDTAANRRS